MLKTCIISLFFQKLLCFFAGRFIAVDHAVPKAKYQDANHVKVAIKKELLDDTKPDIAILDGLSDVKKETGDENDTSFCSEASSKGKNFT